MALLYSVPVSSQALNNQVIEEVLASSDSLNTLDSTQPITKTVIIEGEEEEGEPSSRDKWITAALAALGVVLVIVFRMLRKKKSK